MCSRPPLRAALRVIRDVDRKRSMHAHADPICASRPWLTTGRLTLSPRCASCCCLQGTTCAGLDFVVNWSMCTSDCAAGVPWQDTAPPSGPPPSPSIICRVLLSFRRRRSHLFGVAEEVMGGLNLGLNTAQTQSVLPWYMEFTSTMARTRSARRCSRLPTLPTEYSTNSK